MLVDFHCHLSDFGDFLKPQIIQAKTIGINKWISTALTPDEFRWHLEENHKFLFVAGIHPFYFKNNKFKISSYLETISECHNNKFWGIGEIGLDTRNIDFDSQVKVFSNQVEIAIELQKPLIIHSVKSYYQIAKILKFYQPKRELILHGFNGSPEIIELYRNLNTYFSVNNLILKKKQSGKILKKLYNNKKLLFETDANSSKINLSILKQTLITTAKILKINLTDLIDYYEKICTKII
jgi:TatD DNase family protein